MPITAALVTVVALPVEVTSPVKLALVVTVLAKVAVAAFPPMLSAAAVPVILVPTKVLGVPRFGVTRVGLVANTARPVPVSSDSAPAKPAELVSVFCLPVTAADAALSA